MTVNYKSASIFYTDQGQGTPLILLHGFLENLTMWDSFLPNFTKTHRVVCIDLLGHGQSDCTGYVHNMEDMAAAIYAVVQHLNLNKFTMIGHSMGGYVAIAYAKIYPDATLGICLLNATPMADTQERRVLRTRANSMAKTQYPALVRMSFNNLFKSEKHQQFKIPIQQALEQAMRTTLQGYIAANSGMKDRPDSSSFWLHAPFKKGMILGKFDAIIKLDEQLKNFKNPSSYIKVIDGGHMCHITNFEETLDSINTFLEL